jgi:hypothetical protein
VVLLLAATAGVVLLTRDGDELVVDDVVNVYAGFSGNVSPMDDDHVDPAAAEICDVDTPDADGLSLKLYEVTGTMAVDTKASLDSGRYVVGYTL